MIWELVGKFVFVLSVGFLVAVWLESRKRRRIQYIAWQKRTQAAMTSERARREQAAADREVCAQLELLPASEESND